MCYLINTLTNSTTRTTYRRLSPWRGLLQFNAIKANYLHQGRLWEAEVSRSDYTTGSSCPFSVKQTNKRGTSTYRWFYGTDPTKGGPLGAATVEGRHTPSSGGVIIAVPLTRPTPCAPPPSSIWRSPRQMTGATPPISPPPLHSACICASSVPAEIPYTSLRFFLFKSGWLRT